MWGAIAGAAAGSLISGISSAKAQKDANKTNLQLAREQMQYSSGEARQAEAFSERMSNTAHQREAADLKAAGLNPILAANGGASNPSGAMGSASMAEAKATNPLSGIENAVNSAIETRRLKKELEAQDQQVLMNKEQTNLMHDQANKITDERIGLAQQQRILSEASSARSAQNSAAKAQADLLRAQALEDKKHVKFDSVQSRTQRVLQGVSTVKDIINPLKIK